MRNKKRMTVDPGNMLFVLYVGCVLCIIFLALVVDGYAAVYRGERAEIRPAEVRQGELPFTGAAAKGKYTAAPHLSHDVEMYISGMTAKNRGAAAFCQ